MAKPLREIVPLNELSKKTLNSYYDKAEDEYLDASGSRYRMGRDGEPYETGEESHKEIKRLQGMQRAELRLNRRKGVRSFGETLPHNKSTRLAYFKGTAKKAKEEFNAKARLKGKFISKGTTLKKTSDYGTKPYKLK